MQHRDSECRGPKLEMGMNSPLTKEGEGLRRVHRCAWVVRSGLPDPRGQPPEDSPSFLLC